MKMNTSEGGRCDVDGRGDEYDHNDRGNVRLHTNAANANINLSHTHTHTHTHTHADNRRKKWIARELTDGHHRGEDPLESVETRRWIRFGFLGELLHCMSMRR